MDPDPRRTSGRYFGRVDSPVWDSAYVKEQSLDNMRIEQMPHPSTDQRSLAILLQGHIDYLVQVPPWDKMTL